MTKWGTQINIPEKTEYIGNFAFKGCEKLTEIELPDGLTEIRQGAPDYAGRFCVIGAELKEDRLEELFGL